MPNNLKIVVAGDVTIDWLQWRVEAKDLKGKDGTEAPNWELFHGTKMVPLEGGALLLARLVRAATGLPVLAPRLRNLPNIPPKRVLHSHVLVEEFAFTKAESRRKEDKAKQVIRVKEFLGYCGPGEALDRLKVRGDDPDADLVILDDPGNRFRYEKDAWPLAIKTEGKTPLVILKMSRPLLQGPLWKHLHNNHADRLLVVISADDLRGEEINISRRLSWEHTALDLVRHLAHDEKLKELKDISHFMVRFGLDGAIRYHGETERAWLYYDPKRMESGFQEEVGKGGMTGLAIAFVASFVGQIVQHSREKAIPLQDGLNEVVGLGVREGIKSSRRLLKLGFGQNPDKPDYQDKKLFPPSNKKQPVDQKEPLITEFNLHMPKTGSPPGSPKLEDLENWTILTQTSRHQQEFVAANFLESGANLDLMPLGRFGGLKTVDRREIESLYSIKNLIQEYIQQQRQQRPLSLAVFGPPGAGKSFTVTQVAASVAPDDLKSLEFNLSQMETPHDLVTALHQVRDVSLKGKLPLVFFDEFDCRFRGDTLGWLKYFLAPMQDGAFREGALTFHLSKAIFVFAGGTSPSMEKFSRGALFAKEKAGGKLDKEEKQELEEFKTAKGPDFISRLRGYLNIPGINPEASQPGEDQFHFIRRALLLRELILRKAPNLSDSEKKRLWIDWGVLQGLLKVSSYKHGVRSLQAILEMSRLSGRRKFEAAALPLSEQLRLHVEEKEFEELVRQGARQVMDVEKIAPLIHENYLNDQKGKKPADHPSMQPWETLREDLKESNRGQARHIEVKLKVVNCGYRPAGGSNNTFSNFEPEEIKLMAQIEHERWIMERRTEGYVYGPERNDEKKIHNCLLNWEELSEEVKGWDISAVEAIPKKLLAPLGYEIYRLK